MKLKASGAGLGVALFFIALSLLVFRESLGPNRIFSASDANVGILQAVKDALPQGFAGFHRATPLLGTAATATMQTKNILLSLLPAHVVNDLVYPLYLVAGSLALVAFLRLWSIGWWSAAFGATTAFWMGSITLAPAGHDTKLSVAALFTLSLFLLEKALRARRRTAWGYAMLGGGTVGWMLLEQQDVALLFGIFLGAYVLFRLIQSSLADWKRWIAVLLPVGLVALMLSASTALNAYSRNVGDAAAVQSDPQEKWNFITQWSMVPAEWPDLVAPGYAGWRTNDPEGPYWGAVGQSAEWAAQKQGFRNFRLDSIYIGVLPFLFCALALVVAWKKCKEGDGLAPLVFFWSAAALAALALSAGKYSPLYRLFYHLPLVNNIRAPIKFLHVFQIVAGLLAAVGLDGLVRGSLGSKALKRAAIAGTGLAVLMLVDALIHWALPDSAIRRFVAQGWGQYAPVIVTNIASAWFHAGIMALLFGGGLFAVLRWDRRAAGMIGLTALAAVALDSAWLTSRYFSTTRLGALRNGNAVVDFLEEHQGEDRIYLFDQQGVYNQWLSTDFPYHGIHSFNIWQMPRMEADYRQFLETVGRDYRRLFQLASIRYALGPAGIAGQVDPVMFKPAMYYRFVQNADQSTGVQPLAAPSSPQDQVVMEVAGSIPRFALFSGWRTVDPSAVYDQLVRPEFNPLTSVLVSDADAPPCAETVSAPCQALEPAGYDAGGAVLHVEAAKPGIVLFTQYYQANWKVLVDGVDQPLLRCNGLSMGVWVPAGAHEVRFGCSAWSPGLMVQGLGVVLALGGLVVVATDRRGSAVHD